MTTPLICAEFNEAQLLSSGAFALVQSALNQGANALKINIENADSADELFRVASQLPLQTNEIFWSGDEESLVKIRTLSNQAHIMAPWKKIAAPSGEDLGAPSPQFLSADYSLITQKTIKAAHGLGVKVASSEIDNLPTLRWAVAIGIDLIVTTHFKELQKIISAGPTLDISGAQKTTLDEVEVDRAMDVARILGKWAIHAASTMEPGEITFKKSAADFVTEIDVLIEAHVREVIAANFKGHNFVGEEMGGKFEEDTASWYLDPIDGTTNFANHLPWTSFSFGLAFNRTPLVGIVIDTWRNEIFEAQRGKGAKRNGTPIVVEDQGEIENPLGSRIVSTELAAHKPWPGMYALIDGLAENFCTTRVMGSGTLTMVGVALRRGVGSVVAEFSPIDHLASILIVHEAGGVVWDEEGEVNLFPQKGGVMASTKAASEPLYELWMSAIGRRK
jgi:myo-inositol-1(or 4)-monophosphatase